MPCRYSSIISSSFSLTQVCLSWLTSLKASGYGYSCGLSRNVSSIVGLCITSSSRVISKQSRVSCRHGVSSNAPATLVSSSLTLAAKGGNKQPVSLIGDRREHSITSLSIILHEFFTELCNKAHGKGAQKTKLQIIVIQLITRHTHGTNKEFSRNSHGIIINALWYSVRIY